MLDFNARYLKKRGLPASGTDVAGPHGVVYRAGWGYGLQFHPLANVGALNVHVAAGRTKQAKALANALVARMVPRKRGAVWEYYFPYGSGSAPWTSGMAQAVGAQALARAGKKTAARRAFGSIPGPLVHRLGAGPWIRLYDFSNLVVLNAQLQTILSLREYAEKSGNKRAAQLAANLADAARAQAVRLRHRLLVALLAGAGVVALVPPVRRRAPREARPAHRPEGVAGEARPLRRLHRPGAAAQEGQAPGPLLPVAPRRLPRPRDDRLLALEDVVGHGSRRRRRAPARDALRRLAPDLVEHVQARDAHVHPGRGRQGPRGQQRVGAARPDRARPGYDGADGEGRRQEAAAQVEGDRCGDAVGAAAAPADPRRRAQGRGARPAPARRLPASSASPRHVGHDARRHRLERQQAAPVPLGKLPRSK